MVKAEEILEGDGRKRLVLAGDGHALLGLDGLMQTLVIAAAVHQAAGELVDDDDLAVLDDVVDVTLHNAARLHRLMDMVQQRGILNVGEVLDAEIFLGLGDAAGRQVGRAGFFVDVVVAVEIVLILLLIHGRKDLFAQAGDEEIRHFIELGRFLALAGDDERRARLVDQDRVDLVDDGKIMPALHHVLLIKRHVIAQVIEAQLVVRAVGHVAGIGRAALLRREVMDDQADRQAEEAVHLAHPLGVALGQIVVDRNDMHALAGQRVQVGRQDGDERLALAGLHFGDASLMQNDAADHLHTVRPHPQHAVSRLAADGERLRQKLVERLALLQTRLEFVGFRAQLLVRQLLHIGAQRLHAVDRRGQLLDLALRPRSKHFRKKSHNCPFRVFPVEIMK